MMTSRRAWVWPDMSTNQDPPVGQHDFSSGDCTKCGALPGEDVECATPETSLGVVLTVRGIRGASKVTLPVGDAHDAEKIRKFAADLADLSRRIVDKRIERGNGLSIR